MTANSATLDHATPPAASAPLLRLDKVGYQVGDKVLVSDISFEIDSHDVISLIGPNGAGKSTLAKLMLGLLTPSSGQIIKRDGIIISYVPQKFSVPAILPLQVKDLLAQTHKKRLSPAQKSAIYDALTLHPLLKNQVANLSGGEMQRVLLAKALLDKPDLLVLDEPMQGLDPEAQVSLYELIDSLPEFLRCAMLVVSHDLHWVMKGTKRVICLNRHICCVGQPAEIAEHPEFIALFGQYDDPNHPNSHAYQTPYIHHHDHCGHHA